MTLSKWARLHRSDLVPEPPNRSVIAELRGVVDREIRDAETVESSDGRLGHAHSACLAVAAAALAASGYRVRHGSLAHHRRLIESLQYTLGLTGGQVKELQDYRKKRSLSPKGRWCKSSLRERWRSNAPSGDRLVEKARTATAAESQGLQVVMSRPSTRKGRAPSSRREANASGDAKIVSPKPSRAPTAARRLCIPHLSRQTDPGFP
jgi:hypothetical protein